MPVCGDVVVLVLFGIGCMVEERVLCANVFIGKGSCRIGQGRRKHFKIGQAINFFRLLCSQIFLAPPPLARLLNGLQMLHGF